MSIKCTSRVWEYSTASGTELLVLLAISDHAHEDGTGAYPSLQTLAAKCKISKRSVQRYLKKLSKGGELKIEYGKGRNGTNLYTVLSGLLLTNGEIIIKTICFMCSCEQNETTIFDKHHRIPGDDSSLVDLCRDCHVRLHQLLCTDIGGDNLSPPDVGGDKTKEGDDKNGIKGVTPMSPEPSVNRHIDPSVKRLSSNSNKEWARFIEVYKFYVPHRPQPRATTTSIKNKLITRLKDDYFKVNYERALEKAGKSDFIAEKDFFDAEWFLKNDTNWEKCLNDKYKNNGTSRRKSQAELRQEASDKNIKDIVRNIMEDE